MKNQCWIIAGAASAIAIQFAHAVAKKGDQLILLGRDIEKLSAIQNDLKIRYCALVDIVYFDAEKNDEHVAIAEKCIEVAKNPINLLLAFGVMLSAPAINHSQKDIVKIIDTNFTAVASLSFAFINYFKSQKQGQIIVLGSVAGDRGRPSNFDYGSAKAALIPFCEGLGAALMEYNVSVTLMKLGYIDTPMSYGKTGMFLAASPEACAQACLLAAKNKKTVKYFPWFWQWIILIFKMMPSFILRKIKV